MATRKKPPSILFHYRPPEAWALNNLRNRILYFGAPRNFNDPYDCNPPMLVDPLTRRERGDIVKKYGKERAFAHIALTDMVRQFMGGFAIDQRNLSGVLCLCEEEHNLLMWSQYAGGGRGFCLGFDTRYENKEKSEELVKFGAQNFTRVTYTKNVMDKKSHRLLQKRTPESYKELFSRKAKDWKYEKEWRMFVPRYGALQYEANALKCVCIGTEASKDTREFVRAVVQREYKNTQLWQGRRSKKEYKVVFDPINTQADIEYQRRKAEKSGMASGLWDEFY